jgi:hypothetical protein
MTTTTATCYPSSTHDNKIVIRLEWLGSEVYPTAATVVIGREDISLDYLAKNWRAEPGYCWFKVDSQHAIVRPL